MFNVIRRKIYYIINLINFKRYRIRGSYKKICINGIAFFSGCGNIQLGNNVRINSGRHYNAIGGDTRTILIASPSGKIIIKDNVGISNSSIISQNLIVIEDYVMIGGGCKIYDTDFHSLDFKKRICIPDTDIKTGSIVIKKGAFIGSHSIILKNVTIGENSVIGAGSVVTRDIPANEIWAGNPVKFIKKI